MKKSIFTILLSATVLGGCSSNNFSSIPYGCEGEESSPYCANVETIYENAIKHEGRSINVMAEDKEVVSDGEYKSIQSQKIQSLKSSDGKQLAQEQGSIPQMTGGAVFGSRALEQKPVYTPEKVHRIFRGPWMDDYQILHSGEHLFYKTPGSWNYGNLRTPGSASGMVTPVYPEDLGFNKGGESTTDAEMRRVGRHVIPAPGNNAASAAGKAAVGAAKSAAKKLD